MFNFSDYLRRSSNMLTKSFFVVMAVSMILGQSICRAGDVGNGPVGKEIMNCTGSFTIPGGEGVRVDLRLLPVLGKGLVARVLQTTLQGTVKAAFTVSGPQEDLAGRFYNGQGVSIIIPNIQNPNRPVGTYQALLSVT